MAGGVEAVAEEMCDVVVAAEGGGGALTPMERLPRHDLDLQMVSQSPS